MHAIHPAQSQYHVHSRHPPPSNSTASSSSRHTPAQQPQHSSREPVTVLAVPSVTVEHNQLIVGDARTCQCPPPPALESTFLLFTHSLSLSLSPFAASTRSYTPLKVVGDGSFGTVWLCDWHGTLPPNTPLSAMQCGPGARPEYASKRLVAVKRMKKRWEGGWDECKKLKELEVRSFSTDPFTPSAHSLRSPVTKKYPIPPQHNSPLRFLSPPIQQRALFRVRVDGR